MKKTIFGLLLMIMSAQLSFGQYPGLNPTNRTFTDTEQEIINLSKDKWQWMADKKTDTLKNFFHEKAMFVHMGGSWSKEQEINIIKNGFIWYKKADIHDVTVNIIDNTAILLNRITLLAVVGGNEVSNSFVVTEVYVKQNSSWKLGSLSFSHLPAPPATGSGQNPNSH
ncbi:MAG: nuclear transport factor 2 family protein [Bacteroidetes bacterium]|nr:MAG: nuclear transport factor 2 family protein [Bacteroidota bacterium]